MDTLISKRCKPCEGGTPALTRPEAEARLRELASGWQISADGKNLARAFRFVDFYRAMSFVNALAHIANIENHHPDLEIGYDYCRVRYTTHSISGLSENDFICAAKIDLIDTK